MPRRHKLKPPRIKRRFHIRCNVEGQVRDVEVCSESDKLTLGLESSVEFHPENHYGVSARDLMTQAGIDVEAIGCDAPEVSRVGQIQGAQGQELGSQYLIDFRKELTKEQFARLTAQLAGIAKEGEVPKRSVYVVEGLQEARSADPARFKVNGDVRFVQKNAAQEKREKAQDDDVDKFEKEFKRFYDLKLADHIIHNALVFRRTAPVSGDSVGSLNVKAFVKTLKSIRAKIDALEKKTPSSDDEVIKLKDLSQLVKGLSGEEFSDATAKLTAQQAKELQKLYDNVVNNHTVDLLASFRKEIDQLQKKSPIDFDEAIKLEGLIKLTDDFKNEDFSDPDAVLTPEQAAKLQKLRDNIANDAAKFAKYPPGKSSLFASTTAGFKDYYTEKSTVDRLEALKEKEVITVAEQQELQQAKQDKAYYAEQIIRAKIAKFGELYKKNQAHLDARRKGITPLPAGLDPDEQQLFNELYADWQNGAFDALELKERLLGRPSLLPEGLPARVDFTEDSEQQLHLRHRAANNDMRRLKRTDAQGREILYARDVIRWRYGDLQASPGKDSKLRQASQYMRDKLAHNILSDVEKVTNDRVELLKAAEFFRDRCGENAKYSIDDKAQHDFLVKCIGTLDSTSLSPPVDDSSPEGVALATMEREFKDARARFLDPSVEAGRAWYEAAMPAYLYQELMERIANLEALQDANTSLTREQRDELSFCKGKRVELENELLKIEQQRLRELEARRDHLNSNERNELNTLREFRANGKLNIAKPFTPHQLTTIQELRTEEEQSRERYQRSMGRAANQGVKTSAVEPHLGWFDPARQAPPEDATSTQLRRSVTEAKTRLQRDIERSQKSGVDHNLAVTPWSNLVPQETGSAATWDVQPGDSLRAAAKRNGSFSLLVAEPTDMALFRAFADHINPEYSEAFFYPESANNRARARQYLAMPYNKAAEAIRKDYHEWQAKNLRAVQQGRHLDSALVDEAQALQQQLKTVQDALAPLQEHASGLPTTIKAADPAVKQWYQQHLRVPFINGDPIKDWPLIRENLVHCREDLLQLQADIVAMRRTDTPETHAQLAYKALSDKERQALDKMHAEINHLLTGGEANQPLAAIAQLPKLGATVDKDSFVDTCDARYDVLHAAATTWLDNQREDDLAALKKDISPVNDQREKLLQDPTKLSPSSTYSGAFIDIMRGLVEGDTGWAQFAANFSVAANACSTTTAGLNTSLKGALGSLQTSISQTISPACIGELNTKKPDIQELRNLRDQLSSLQQALNKPKAELFGDQYYRHKSDLIARRIPASHLSHAQQQLGEVNAVLDALEAAENKAMEVHQAKRKQVDDMHNYVDALLKSQNFCDTYHRHQNLAVLQANTTVAEQEAKANALIGQVVSPAPVSAVDVALADNIRKGVDKQARTAQADVREFQEARTGHQRAAKGLLDRQAQASKNPEAAKAVIREDQVRRNKELLEALAQAACMNEHGEVTYVDGVLAAQALEDLLTRSYMFTACADSLERSVDRVSRNIKAPGALIAALIIAMFRLLFGMVGSAIRIVNSVQEHRLMDCYIDTYIAAKVAEKAQKDDKSIEDVIRDDLSSIVCDENALFKEMEARIGEKRLYDFCGHKSGKMFDHKAIAEYIKPGLAKAAGRAAYRYRGMVQKSALSSDAQVEYNRLQREGDRVPLRREGDAINRKKVAEQRESQRTRSSEVNHGRALDDVADIAEAVDSAAIRFGHSV